MEPQFPHGEIRQNRGAKCPSPCPQGFPKSLTREGQEFCPGWQGNDEGSSKSCGPQLPLRGFPVMNPKLRMTSVPRPGPRGGSSRIWPQLSALTIWERSGADPGVRATQPASPHSSALAEAEGDGMGREPGGEGRGRARSGHA